MVYAQRIQKMRVRSATTAHGVDVKKYIQRYITFILQLFAQVRKKARRSSLEHTAADLAHWVSIKHQGRQSPVRINRHESKLWREIANVVV